MLGYNPFGASLGGGTLKNDAGATIDIQGSNQIPANPFGATSFTNAGTLEKTVGTGVAGIDVNFTDTGTIKIASGTLEFGADASFAGLVSGAGTLSFAAGRRP